MLRAIDPVEYDQLLSYCRERFKNIYSSEFNNGAFTNWITSPQSWILGNHEKPHKEIQVIQEMMEYIIKHQLKKLLQFLISIDHPALYFSEVLHLAAQHNKPEMINLLISAGFDVNMPTTQKPHSSNEYAITPLHTASHYGSVDATKCLLGHGANPNAYTVNDIYHYPPVQLFFDVALRKQSIPYYQNETPLHAAIDAAYTGHFNLDAVKALLEGGANPNLPAGRKQETALLLAISSLSYNDRNRDKLPLVELVTLLISHNADPRIRSCCGGDAMQYLYGFVSNLEKRDPIEKSLKDQIVCLSAKEQPIPKEVSTVATPIYSSPITFMNEWKAKIKNGKIVLTIPIGTSQESTEMDRHENASDTTRTLSRPAI